jgi:hypothetical protein
MLCSSYHQRIGNWSNTQPIVLYVIIYVKSVTENQVGYLGHTRKLYGVILEDVAGEKSPYIKQLHKGTEIRNRLVHRPEAVRLDPQKVADYVAGVDHAMWHLIGLCRTRGRLQPTQGSAIEEL